MQFHPNALFNDLNHERLSKSKDKASLRKIARTLGERITIKSDSDKLETFPENRIKFHSASCKVLGKKSLIKYRMRNCWFLPGRILELCWITRWAGVNNVSLWWKGESPSWDVWKIPPKPKKMSWNNPSAGKDILCPVSGTVLQESHRSLGENGVKQD